MAFKKNNSYNSEFYLYIILWVSIPWKHTSDFLECWNKNCELDINPVSDFSIILHKIRFFRVHVFNSSLPIAVKLK